MLPNSSVFTKPGHEALAEEVERLLPVRNLSDPRGKLIRWDGKTGTAQELSALCLEEIRAAIAEGDDQWKDLGAVHGISRAYHVKRTELGNGNRFFRFHGVLKVPPQLIIAALFEPGVLGKVDKTVRHVRVLQNFADGKHRLVSVVAEAGPRPLFYDRDDCALSAYFPPSATDSAWYQVSCTVPSHFPSVSSAVRNHTMYWGYKFEPFTCPDTGAIHTKTTLISQTEIFGWLPKLFVNQFIPGVLAHYMRSLEAELVTLMDRGAPARLLVESYGLRL